MVIQTIGRGSSGYKEALSELGTGLGGLAGTLIGAKLANKNRQQQDSILVVNLFELCEHFEIRKTSFGSTPVEIYANSMFKGMFFSFFKSKLIF